MEVSWWRHNSRISCVNDGVRVISEPGTSFSSSNNFFKSTIKKNIALSITTLIGMKQLIPDTGYSFNEQKRRLVFEGTYLVRVLKGDKFRQWGNHHKLPSTQIGDGRLWSHLVVSTVAAYRRLLHTLAIPSRGLLYVLSTSWWSGERLTNFVLCKSDVVAHKIGARWSRHPIFPNSPTLGGIENPSSTRNRWTHTGGSPDGNFSIRNCTR